MQYAKTGFSFKRSSLQPGLARRRSLRRCPDDMTAEIEIDGGGRTCQCRVVDLSAHGIGCLECEDGVNLSENATIIIWLTHADDAFLPVLGRVVHRRDYGSFRHMGIELDPEGAEMVGIGSLA